MDRKSWETIQEIFNAAVELPRSERDAYILAASQGDMQLYSQVDSLLKTDDLAEGFLEPIFGPFSPTPSPLRPGDMLSRRFRIQRLIGEGGMGHVFEAWDTELGRPVALKTIRPEIARQPEALRRFRREVSLALILTHPHICRTFDIARDTLKLDQARGGPIELHYLTMEFLHGETLAARILRDGALPLNEAQPLALQIGDALTCAHTQGIYHRDIKPANVMLATSSAAGSSPSLARVPRAVLTDFGLARQEALYRTDDFSAFSQSGLPLGTLPYMAPEQLEGKPATPATDIYAFGLVLFEMVTGKRVFPSGNAEINLAERLTTAAPSPRTHIPNLPEQWCQAIEGCLRLDPATRYQSATEVLTVLSGGHIALPTIRSQRFTRLNQSPRWFALSQWPTKLKITAALFSLLLMSLFAWTLRLYMQQGEAAVAPGALVYMTQIKNETGEKSFDNLSELMQAGLTQSAHINLLDQGRIGDILQQMTKPPDTVITEPIAREIALRTNAVRVVFASVTGHNGSYQLKVDIQQPDTSSPTRYRDHWQKTFQWQSTGTTNNGTIPAELLTTIRNTSDWIRKEVGESANDIARLDAPPEDVTTSSWEGLNNYKHAIELHRNLKDKEAVEFLKKAVAIDPQFALAYGRLGDLQFSIGDSIEGLRNYSKALELTELQRLTLRERDRIRGLAGVDSGDFQVAEQAFRDYTVNYEHDYLGWFYLGHTLMMLGRAEEGLEDLRKSYALNPMSMSVAAQLAKFETATGHFEFAGQRADHLAASGKSGLADYVRGLIAFFQGNSRGANDYFTRLQSEPGFYDRSSGTRMLVNLAAEQGRFHEAIDLLNFGIVEDRQIGNRPGESSALVGRGSIQARLGAFPEMLDDIQAAWPLDKSPVTVTLAADTLGKSLRIASPHLRARIHQQLTIMDLQYSGLDLGIYSRIAKLRLHAYLLLADGKWEVALNEARKAAALEPPVSDRAFLATFLLAASEHATEPQRKIAMLEEAYTTLERSIHNSAYTWKETDRSVPGFLATEMEDFVVLATRLNKDDDSVSKAKLALLRLRPAYKAQAHS